MRDLCRLDGQVRLHQAHLFFVTVVELCDFILNVFDHLVTVLIQLSPQVMIIQKLLRLALYLADLAFIGFQILSVGYMRFFVFADSFRVLVYAVAHLSFKLVEFLIDGIHLIVTIGEQIVLDFLYAQVKYGLLFLMCCDLIVEESLHC